MAGVSRKSVHLSKYPYLIRVMLSAGGSGRSGRRQPLIGGGRRRGTDAALRRVRSLCAPRTRVLLLQRPGHVEGYVALIPRRRSLSARRPVLLPTTRLILVVRMLAFVDHAETIGLLDKWLLVAVRQQSAIRRSEEPRDQRKSTGDIISRYFHRGSHARSIRFFAFTRLERRWNEKRFYHRAQYTRGVEMGGLVNVSRRVES